MDHSPSPDKVRKWKGQAYNSFFGKGVSAENSEEPEDRLENFKEELERCTVCQTDLGSKKKQCGACQFYACSQHLRKKRKDRNGSLARVCDDCEDKYLFENYMRFELKAEEAIVMHEQIVTVMKRQIDERLKGKESKVTVLLNHAEDVKQRHSEATKKIMITHNEVERKLQVLDQQQKESDALENQLNELEKGLPRPLSGDIEALYTLTLLRKIEDDKITRQLVRLEKRCNELIQAISQKQKDIHSAYESWQQQQKQKKGEQDKCKVS